MEQVLLFGSKVGREGFLVEMERWFSFSHRLRKICMR